MIPKNRYLVFGYFGGWNSGDEAIFESVRRMLSFDRDDIGIVAICSRLRPEYASVYENQNVQMLEARSLVKIFRTLITHQLIVGGGQMITGDRSLKGLYYIFLLCLMARVVGNHPRMVGIGVEGVQRYRVKFLVRCIASMCQRIGARDEYSLELLQQAGCNSKRVRLTADVVLSGVVRVRSMALAKDSPVVIGIHQSPIRCYSNKTLYLNLIAAVRRHFPERYVVVVSNDARPTFDAGLLDDLQSKIGDDGVVWQHFDSLQKSIEIYGSAACVVSVRMHPLILALIQGVNVVGIAKSNKIIALAKRVGFQIHDTDTEGIETILPKIQIAIDSDVPQLGNLKDLAWSNFEGLDQG